MLPRTNLSGKRGGGGGGVLSVCFLFWTLLRFSFHLRDFDSGHIKTHPDMSPFKKFILLNTQEDTPFFSMSGIFSSDIFSPLVF